MFNQFDRNEAIIRNLRAKIQNLQYDKDLLHQESRTASGLFKKTTLNKQIKIIDNEIKNLQAELKKAELDQQEEISKPLITASPQYNIQKAEFAIEKVEKLQTENLQMTKINVKIGDNNSINTIAVAGEYIKDSFNQADSADISNDLKSVLKELAVAVGKMSEQLLDAEANQAARDLKSLTDEATSSAPRQKWWELSIEGLKQAAQNVGEIGKPVLDLVAKIVPILLAMSA